MKRAQEFEDRLMMACKQLDRKEISEVFIDVTTKGGSVVHYRVAAFFDIDGFVEGFRVANPSIEEEEGTLEYRYYNGRLDIVDFFREISYDIDEWHIEANGR